MHQRTPTRTRYLQEFLRPARYNSPDCPVYTGLSGEPRSNGYLGANGHRQAHSMRARGAQMSGTPILAHRTMNSTCPVCTGHPCGPRSQKLQRSESNGIGDVAGAPDMSGVHRTVRCTSGATAISAPTATCDAFIVRSARAEGRRAHTGAPDNEQEMSGVHRTSRRAHKSGAPTVRIQRQ